MCVSHHTLPGSAHPTTHIKVSACLNHAKHFLGEKGIPQIEMGTKLRLTMVFFTVDHDWSWFLSWYSMKIPGEITKEMDINLSSMVGIYLAGVDLTCYHVPTGMHLQIQGVAIRGAMSKACRIPILSVSCWIFFWKSMDFPRDDLYTSGGFSMSMLIYCRVCMWNVGLCCDVCSEHTTHTWSIESMNNSLPRTHKNVAVLYIG